MYAYFPLFMGSFFEAHRLSPSEISNFGYQKVTRFLWNPPIPLWHPSTTKVSAKAVTAKALSDCIWFHGEQLGRFVTMPSAPTLASFKLRLFCDFRAIPVCTAPQNFVCTIRQVIWPSPGTHPRALKIGRTIKLSLNPVVNGPGHWAFWVLRD